jgi:parvulin-like peptidyl-prolyl isomerase
MRISRKLAALAAFFVIAAAIAGCGSSIQSDSVADVAGNPITLQAFNHWMYVAAKGQAAQAAEQGQTEPIIVPTDPPKYAGCLKQVRAQIPSLATTATKTLVSDCSQLFTQYTNQVLTFLIEGYWYQADAYKQGIKYTSADLTKAFNKAFKTEFKTKAAFNAYLKSSGQTKADILFQLRVNAIYAKLIKRFEKPANAAAIQAYYNAHKSQFGTQATADIHLVRTTSQAKAQAALNALKSGQSWDTVAKQYAEDASAKTTGGVLTGVTNGEEEAAVNKVIFASPVNKLEGPIKGVFGFYVLEVTKSTPAVTQSLAKATPSIKQVLTQQEQTKAEAAVTAQAKKNFGKQTTCRTPYYQVTMCTNYKAPKTTTTTTPTSAAPTPTTTGTTPANTSTVTTAASTTTTAG